MGPRKVKSEVSAGSDGKFSWKLVVIRRALTTKRRDNDP